MRLPPKGVKHRGGWSRNLATYILFTIIFIPLFSNCSHCQNANVLLPISCENRSSIASIQLTPIGAFGLTRKTRRNVPQHLHTGIDIRRPGNNYFDEPVFAIAPGVVISRRDDGPFAQIIIEHESKDCEKFWTVYEHVAGIGISVGDSVSPTEPIARFMNRDELNRYGWQFDHFHFEVLKVAPRHLKPTPKTPHRLYRVYNLECYTQSDLYRYYFDPLEFLDSHLNEKAE